MTKSAVPTLLLIFALLAGCQTTDSLQRADIPAEPPESDGTCTAIDESQRKKAKRAEFFPTHLTKSATIYLECDAEALVFHEWCDKKSGIRDGRTLRSGMVLTPDSPIGRCLKNAVVKATYDEIRRMDPAYGRAENKGVATVYFQPMS